MILPFLNKKLMRVLFYPLLLLLFFIFDNNAYSMSDYRIKEICKNKPRRSTCIKNLKFKKINLLKGNQIEIPVIPFKK